MSDIRLVGLDFGTTTSSAVVASAALVHNSVSGKRELTGVREVYRSEIVFTPFTDHGLDESKLEEYVDAWLAAGDTRSDEIFGGGALLTGLAAQQKNASVLVQLIRSRLGSALIATADDPCLESWLAFHASAAGISKSQPDRWIVNLDIGGGTTNIALGKDGDVLCTGCLFVGARHVQFIPGTYQIVKLSACARRLFEHLDIGRGPGDCLDREQIESLLDFYMRLIENSVAGNRTVFEEPIAQLHQQVPFDPPADLHDPIITASGGVGELIYKHLQGTSLPSTTFFGDLGIDLARRFLAAPRYWKDFRAFVPACGGRATVYGLLRHTTQVSGSTLFLPNPALLPLRDLPILGRITPKSTDEQIRDILQLVGRSSAGGCAHIVASSPGASVVAALGGRIADALKTLHFPATRPLVLAVRENFGKALGHYVSEWGTIPLNLVVVDEIEIRDARFIQIGSAHNQIVPISFYGMN